MNRLYCVGIFVVLGISLDRSARAADPPSQPAGVEILARGPIHEGFAQPMNASLEHGSVVAKAPPEPIDELPPDQKPEGDDVQWLPGYWAWDDEPGEYIWVSGFWRMPPPGRHWLPGHWQEVDKGWLWVAGFWSGANLEELQYLPPPPPSIDQGPSTPAPDDSSSYVAGIWIYQQARYMWRPGFWFGNRPNWIWTPAYYTSTPSGCLYNDGYWDHPLEERGLLFAPVRFAQEWDNRPYIPQYVVNSDFLIGSLFVGPSARHYYFGDYFENRYAAQGFVAWPDYRVGRSGYDPNFNYYRTQRGAGPRWESGLRDLYHARASGEVSRPPQTLLQQLKAVNTISVNKTGDLAVHKNVNLTNVQNVTALTSLSAIHNTSVTNLASLSNTKEARAPVRVLKLETVPKEEHAREQKEVARMRAAAQQRGALETKLLHQGGAPVKHTDPPKSVKLELPKSTPRVVAPRQSQKVPPALPVLPKHEERPLPKNELGQPPPQPKKALTPLPPAKADVPPPQPKKVIPLPPPPKTDVPPPQPKKDVAPPPLPKTDVPPPPQPKKDVPPPPQPKKDAAPPPQPKKEVAPPPPPKTDVPPPQPKKDVPPPPQPQKEPPPPKKKDEKTSVVVRFIPGPKPQEAHQPNA